MNKNSLAAYRSIGEFLEGHNLVIYDALLAKGPQTCWEISSLTWWMVHHCDLVSDLDPSQVFRRMRDLERAGYVERMEWVKDSPSGRACSVWWVSTKETK
jgi:hypothetical protein